VDGLRGEVLVGHALTLSRSDSPGTWFVGFEWAVNRGECIGRRGMSEEEHAAESLSSEVSPAVNSRSPTLCKAAGGWAVPSGCLLALVRDVLPVTDRCMPGALCGSSRGNTSTYTHVSDT
jgi:hypothetical protein